MGRLDLFDNLREHRPQIIVQHHLAEVDEADAGIELGVIEELELLLIPEHLEGRFPEHGEEQRGTFGGGVGENDLMGQRRLPAAGSAGDDVERELGQAAPEDLIETGHAGGQLPNDHFF